MPGRVLNALSFLKNHKIFACRAVLHGPGCLSFCLHVFGVPQGKTLERFILASRSITNAVSLTIVITPCELFLLLLQFQPTIAVARSHMYIASLAHPQVIATEKSPSVRAPAASSRDGLSFVLSSVLPSFGGVLVPGWAFKCVIVS